MDIFQEARSGKGPFQAAVVETLRRLRFQQRIQFQASIQASEMLMMHTLSHIQVEAMGMFPQDLLRVLVTSISKTEHANG